MKITKNVLREMIEAELSLLTEANEKEALRAYFSINDQIKLGQGDRGDIVTALQDFLIEKSNEESLSAVDSIKSAVEAMGEPDGNIGPKTVAAINAFQGHFELEETGVYNSAVHDAIAGPAPAVEAEAEEESAEEESAEEESADFPHPKWDALTTESEDFFMSELSKLSAEEAKALLSTISKSGEKTFRDNLITFVEGYELIIASGVLRRESKKYKLTNKMKYAIKKKLLIRKNDIPAWLKAENVSEEFDSIVDEKFNDSEFNLLIKLDDEETNDQLLEDQAARELKEQFVAKFIDDGGEFVPKVEFGDLGTNITGIQDQQSVYFAVSEIIEKWDVVTRAEEVEETEEPTQLSESRFQKLAGI